jgi:hypothetical protein
LASTKLAARSFSFAVAAHDTGHVVSDPGRFRIGGVREHNHRQLVVDVLRNPILKTGRTEERAAALGSSFS